MSTQTLEAPVIPFDYDTPRTVVYESVRRVEPRGVTDRGDVDEPYTPRVVLRNPCLVYDEVTKKERWARLLKGYSSIWKDEQEKDGRALDDKLISPLTIHPELISGYLFVELPKDKLLAQFLNVHDDREKDPRYRKSSKPVRFRLKETASDSKTTYAAIALQQKAVNAAMAMSDDDMLVHCKFLAIPLIDKFNQKIETGDLRVMYIQYAQRNPKLFLESSVGSNMKLHNAITALTSSGDIDIASVKGSAIWGATKALIMEFDTNSQDTPTAQLAKFALSDKGTDLKARLEKSVKDSKK